MSLTIGIYRTVITPPWGVELSGLGYYLQRTWQKVRDDLTATALVVDDGKTAAALVATDLMYMDAAFTQGVRQMVAQYTDIPAEAVCVAASHSHNAPTAGVIRGCGERDAAYLAMAQRQAATAVICAWKQRRPASLHVGHTSSQGSGASNQGTGVRGQGSETSGEKPLTTHHSPLTTHHSPLTTWKG